MKNWMNGNGQNKSAECWSNIKEGDPVHVSIEFIGQGVTLTDEDISLDTGVTITDIFNGDTDLVFGKTVCKQIRLRILNSSKLNGLSWTGETYVKFHVPYGNDTYFINFGYFYGEQPKNVTTARYIDFTAYDAMKKFDIPADNFINGITYPITLSQLFSDLCSYVGVSSQIGDALNTKNRSFASAPVDMTGYSCRDILGWIAEACGCYAKMSLKQCKLVWFHDNTGHSVTPTEEFKVESADLNPGLTWDEFDELTNAEQEAMTLNDIAGYQEAYAVDQMMVKQVDSDFNINYPNSYGENIYAITDNPFIIVSSWDDVVNYVKPLYDRLSAFGGYLPFNAECIGDPAVEAGDIITVDINGTTLTAPVFVKTMRWNGSFTDIYETTGQIPRSEYGTNANRQSVLNANSMKMFVRNQYYNRQSGIEITDEGVTLSGDKYFNINIANSYFWRYDENGISLKEDGDEMFNYRFYIGEGDASYQKQTAMTEVSFHDRTFIADGRSYEWHELTIGQSHKFVENGHTYTHFYPFIFGVGFTYDGDYNPALLPYGDGYFLGDTTRHFTRVYTSYVCGFKLPNGNGRATIIPSDDDMQTRFQLLTDANHMYAQKAGSSAKTLIYRGFFEGGTVGQTTNETDMNNLTTPGHYWMTFSSSVTNKPSSLANNSYCEVIVSKAPEGVSNDIHQMIIKENEIYVRLAWMGTSWGNWYKFSGTQV